MEDKVELYTYYATRQGVGSCPKDGLVKNENYDFEKFEPSVQRNVSAKLYYNRLLNKDEIKSYELYEPWNEKELFKKLHLMNLHSQFQEDVSNEKEEKQHYKETDAYLENFSNLVELLPKQQALLIVDEKNLTGTNKKTAYHLDYIGEALVAGNFDSGCDVALDTEKNEFVLADYATNGTFKLFSYSIAFPENQLSKEQADLLLQKVEEEGYVELDDTAYKLHGDNEAGKKIRDVLVKTYGILMKAQAKEKHSYKNESRTKKKESFRNER